jgi:hypothetical protein
MSNAVFNRDANRVPITLPGMMVTKSLSLTASNTTVNPPIFTITGTVMVVSLYGIVTTAVGVNNTAASFRINDQTAQVYLTAVGGTTLSAAPAGSIIMKTALVATALTLKSSAAGAILEAGAANEYEFSPIIIVDKVNALTQIEFKYTTTDTPTTGVIKFYCGFIPMSDDGDVTAV